MQMDSIQVASRRKGDRIILIANIFQILWIIWTSLRGIAALLYFIREKRFFLGLMIALVVLGAGIFFACIVAMLIRTEGELVKQLADLERSQRHFKTTVEEGVLEPGTWRCTCGRKNQDYVSTCACGKNKREVLLLNSKKE